jgi:hypothetical protein
VMPLEPTSTLATARVGAAPAGAAKEAAATSRTSKVVPLMIFLLFQPLL